MNAPSETSLNLLSRLTRKDGDAWHVFNAVYVPVLYEKCRRSGLQEADTSDLVQETMIKIQAALPDFDRQRPGSFRTWMNTIRLNVIRDFQRRKVREIDAVGGSQMRDALEHLAEEASGEESLSGTDSDSVRIVAAALEQIRPRFQPHVFQAFWRTRVDDQPAPAVAEELGMSHTAVRNAAYRVDQALREFFEGMGFSPDSP